MLVERATATASRNGPRGQAAPDHGSGPSPGCRAAKGCKTFAAILACFLWRGLSHKRGGGREVLAQKPGRRRFQVVLIKPSHYDDEGYVVQWLRSAIPSNSLAVVYSLAADAAAREALGPDVEITISAVDECNTRIRPDKIIQEFRKSGCFGLVGLVGVQSNQFPRALDIARPLREVGIPVVIGGFHVSGCLAMLPEVQTDLKAALGIGATLFAGELEGRIRLPPERRRLRTVEANLQLSRRPSRAQ